MKFIVYITNCIVYIIFITHFSFHSALLETSCNIKKFQVRFKLVSECRHFVSFLWILRRSRPDVFNKKSFPRNFAKFTGKHPCQSFSFNKVAGHACNFIKIETLSQVLSCEFCEISINDFFYRTPPVAASEYCYLLLPCLNSYLYFLYQHPHQVF